MTDGVVDSTVIIHLLRRNKLALDWAVSLTEKLSVTSITCLEILMGIPNKAELERSKVVLQQFDFLALNAEDQRWAVLQLEQYRLSKGVASNDCMIASLCHRLKIPVYTHNLKDYLKVLPATLVIQPY